MNRIWILLGAFILGCGGAPKVKNTIRTATPQTEPSVQERIATAYNGPRIRVAVGEFKELDGALALYKEMGWTGITPGLTEQVTTALVQSGRVAVLERAQIKKVVGNIALENEGELNKYFDKKTTVQTGKLLGAQAVLVGAVTQFEPNISGFSAGVDFKVMNLIAHQNKAVVGVDIRLVDQESGKLIVAAHGVGEIDTTVVGGEGSYKGVEFGGKAWRRTPLGVATRQATEEAIKTLMKGIQSTPWEGKIFQVKGQRVFIQAGTDLNLRKGDTFRVIHRGELLKGPDGEPLGFDDTEGGLVTLVSVQPKMSIATVKEGAPPKVGDVVQVYTQ